MPYDAEGNYLFGPHHFMTASQFNGWVPADKAVPKTLIPASRFRDEVLLAHTRDIPEHYAALGDKLVSLLVLTLGIRGVDQDNDIIPNYEIGFWDGSIFRGLQGYRIYPDPDYWMPLPGIPSEMKDHTV